MVHPKRPVFSLSATFVATLFFLILAFSFIF